MIGTPVRSMPRALAIAAVSLVVVGSITVPVASLAASAPTVKIGVEGPMTGPQAATGIDMWNGVSLLVQKINASDGVLGQKITLVRIDDKTDAKTAAAVARAAIAEHVVAVVGPYNSSVGIVNLPIYRAAGVITIRLTSNHATDKLGITVQPMDYQVATIEADAIVKSLAKKSKVAIVYDTSAYTAGIATQLKALLQTGGLTVSAFQPVTSTQSNFPSELAAVKAADPALTYYVAYDPQAEDLVIKAHQLSITGICFVDGLAAEGSTFVKATGVALSQGCAYSGVPSAAQFPDDDAYSSSYQATFHTAPGTWGVFAYDSAAVLFHAANAAKTWHASAVNAKLSHTAAFPGITGSISINPATGSRNNPPVVLLNVNASGNYIVSPLWKTIGKLPAVTS